MDQYLEGVVKMQAGLANSSAPVQTNALLTQLDALKPNLRELSQRTVRVESLKRQVTEVKEQLTQHLSTHPPTDLSREGDLPNKVKTLESKMGTLHQRL